MQKCGTSVHENQCLSNPEKKLSSLLLPRPNFFSVTLILACKNLVLQYFLLQIFTGLKINFRLSTHPTLFHFLSRPHLLQLSAKHFFSHFFHLHRAKLLTDEKLDLSVTKTTKAKSLLFGALKRDKLTKLFLDLTIKKKKIFQLFLRKALSTTKNLYQINVYATRHEIYRLLSCKKYHYLRPTPYQRFRQKRFDLYLHRLNSLLSHPNRGNLHSFFSYQFNKLKI